MVDSFFLMPLVSQSWNVTANRLTRLIFPDSTSFVIAGKQRSKAIALKQIVAKRVFPIASSPRGILIALRISVRNVVDIVDFPKKATVTRMFLITYIAYH